MQKILKNVYENKKKLKLCLALSTISAYCSAVLFGLQLLYHLLGGEYITLAVVAGFAAAGFIAVTVARKLINAKRPYEVYAFYDVPPRNKTGESHPSRHSYSAAVIATLGFAVSPFLTLGTGILALIIAVTRVVTGVHFVRDVIAGLTLGILFGGAGLLTLFLI